MWEMFLSMWEGCWAKRQAGAEGGHGALRLIGWT